ncbi:hypothetical protein M8C21_006350 [Ambrosia artemisiifolia]|uniref:Reverse transcriptase zinc-binding domain-containing protein n=1 Tax=Ambrosia artemisiifolia TaxID=4212 RepID=A0AAD5CKK9_AMBAR|nr:hypothetical protein M8C21_006350 [Ambrosia artemisiifolia]
MVRSDLANQLDLNGAANAFKWNRIATPKVNLFAWRALDKKIPVATELVSRGVNLQTTMCRMCNVSDETSDQALQGKQRG